MIIVTGGAGFIGSNIVLGLNRLGHNDIVVVDNLRNAVKHRNLSRARFADIIDKEDLFDALPALANVEAVFHQGACADTTEADGRYMMKNNYEYSKRLLHFAEERGARFIYASSAAVYGCGAAGFREEPACEDPLNVYGFSKLTFDNYVRQRLDQSPSRIVGLRYFNVYGPNERHKARMASVAMHLFDQLDAAGCMKLFEGSADFKRDFIHVDDVVAVNLFFMSSDARGIFNCGSGRARPFTDIASTLRRVRGSGEVESIPFPDDLAGKYQRFTEADLRQLRAAGYAAEFVSLEQGVETYYAVLHARRTAIAESGRDMDRMTRASVFLDRDGTLIEDSGFVHLAKDLVILPGVIDGLQRLKAAGFLLIVVTNQSGVARGHYSEAAVLEFHRHLNDQLGPAATIDAFYYCPYHPEAELIEYRRDSTLRKPGIGMFEQACADFAISRHGSYMVGDRATDMGFGRRAGLQSILVRTGEGRSDEQTVREFGSEVVDDFLAAATSILQRQGVSKT